MKYVFFVHLRALPSWLALTRLRRREMVAKHISPLLRPAADQLILRHFDAEAFTAACSDIMMIETESPQRHYFFIEALRDTPLLTVPFFDIVAILPAIEDGYAEYEKIA